MSRLIGKAALAAGVVTLLGAVPDLDAGATVNIRFANRGAADTRVWAWVGTGAGPTDADAVTPGVQLRANTPFEDTGLSVDPGDKVWVMAEGAGITARAHGM